MPREWLAGSPFTSYLIPSVVLVVVVGGSHLMASVRVWQRHREARRLSQLAGMILIGWITAQLAIIGFVSWLQLAMLVAALLELALAARATAATRGTRDQRRAGVAEARLRPELAGGSGPGRAGEFDLVVRVGRGAAMPKPLRRPVKSVVI
ncbi:MAG: hypothetical protein MZW92_24760 [Comamonadaceae bacterium]|nr:hypothetical protein [Comamonadaceae bacterium]